MTTNNHELSLFRELAKRLKKKKIGALKYWSQFLICPVTS